MRCVTMISHHPEYPAKLVARLSGLKIYAGAGASKNNFTLEFGYVDFGEVTITAYNTSNDLFADQALEFSTIYLAATGIFPFSESWDLITKLGLHSYDVVYSLSTNSPNDVNSTFEDISDTDVLYGIGFQWHNANGFGVRGEWESFNMDLDTDVTFDFYSRSLSIFKRF